RSTVSPSTARTTTAVSGPGPPQAAATHRPRRLARIRLMPSGALRVQLARRAQVTAVAVRHGRRGGADRDAIRIELGRLPDQVPVVAEAVEERAAVADRHVAVVVVVVEGEGLAEIRLRQAAVHGRVQVAGE